VVVGVVDVSATATLAVVGVVVSVKVEAIFSVCCSGTRV
jgi:hypothetical protein